ncbi:MAG: glycosyltransferase family 2 protein [Candidatus Marinimicrobia bacterium]|nr:glycosyltransferase family 2 protein [Candidatus Neomarinimicrobiota bacterium]
MKEIQKISILLPTFNCQTSVRASLASVEWADEIIVIDSFSKDDTIKIATEYGVRVFQHEYINSAKQKNWAIQHCPNEWIFQIDSDEILEEKAEGIIRDAINNAGENTHCFKMPRKNHVLGKWVKYGGLYPDWEYRLFRKVYGKWWDREVHSRIVVPGEVQTLETPLIHHGMPNISKQLSNLNRYTRYEADELSKKKIKFSFVKWVLGPIYYFMKRYILLQGYRDGWRGFFLAVYAGFYFFLSQAKLFEMETLKLKRSPE